MPMETPALEQPTVQSRGNQLRFILDVGTRHWLIILVATLVCCLGYGIASLLLLGDRGIQFIASTDLVVQESPYDKEILRGLAGPALSKISPETLVGRATKFGYHKELARAIVQEDIEEGGPWAGVATETELAQKTHQLQNQVQLIPDRVSKTIQVKVSASTEAEAHRIAELAARVFIDCNRQLMLDEGEQTHQLIKDRLEECRNELERAEAAEWRQRKLLGPRTHEELRQHMAHLREELLQAQVEKRNIGEKMSQIENELRAMNDQFPQVLGNLTDDVVDKLFGELVNLQTEEVLKDVEFVPESQQMQDLASEIDAAEAAIVRKVQELDQDVGDGTSLWQRRKQLHSEYTRLQMDLTSLDIKLNTYPELLGRMEEELPTLASKSFEYQSIVQEAERRRESFSLLIDKEFEVRMAMMRESGGVERRRPVEVGKIQKRRRKTALNFVVGALAGFLLGFGLAVAIEIMDTSIRGIDDVAEYIGLDVIGTIPKMEFGQKRRGRRRGNVVEATGTDQIDACIVTQHDPKSPISEAYRALRTNFQFATIQRRPKTIMVTSAVPGEGKTTTAVNMAVTLADSGMRVLVIDTDLRRPHVHHVLRMERGPGLADVLRQGLEFRSVVRSTRIENLSLISSGRVPPNPSELIGSERMSRLMASLGQEYDLVICDAPSILVVTDPVLLAANVDAVVLVVSTNYARRETIVRAKKLMETAHAYMPGVVLNGLEASRRHYYYYYYYYDDMKTHRRRRWFHF